MFTYACKASKVLVDVSKKTWKHALHMSVCTEGYLNSKVFTLSHERCMSSQSVSQSTTVVLHGREQQKFKIQKQKTVDHCDFRWQIANACEVKWRWAEISLIPKLVFQYFWKWKIYNTKYMPHSLNPCNAHTQGRNKLAVKIWKMFWKSTINTKRKRDNITNDSQKKKSKTKE